MLPSLFAWVRLEPLKDNRSRSDRREWVSAAGKPRCGFPRSGGAKVRVLKCGYAACTKRDTTRVGNTSPTHSIVLLGTVEPKREAFKPNCVRRRKRHATRVGNTSRALKITGGGFCMFEGSIVQGINLQINIDPCRIM